ncbi:MAG TPA: SUMF1/EgtB/PvdO family nonheme iron enzyme [Tepidisphaeraceae bacterium]|nr:SUMF1/EgtB/PvdO family nonheme iron enzyme [Tepidisphaeraceae bacterium]
MRTIHGLIALVAAMGIVGMRVSVGRCDEGGSASQWAKAMLQKRQAVQQEASNLPQHSQWYTSGDLRAKSFNDSLFPEKGVKLDGKRTDGKALWTAMPQWQNGQVVQLSSGDRTATYLYRTIECKTPVKMTAGFGSDDGITVWLNGKKIHSLDVPRGAGADQDRVPLDLKAGTNELLVRIYNISGGCGFYYSLGPSYRAVADQLRDSYPVESRWFQQYFPESVAWFTHASDTELDQKTIAGLLGRLQDPQPQKAQLEELVKKQTPANDPAWLTLFVATAERVQAMESAQTLAKSVNFEALRLSIQELKAKYPDTYRNGQVYLDRVDELEKQAPAFHKALLERNDKAAREYIQACQDLKHKALVVDNPVVNFDKLLVVKREAGRLGLPQNWQGNTSIDPRMDNEIATLDIKAPSKLKTVYKPAKPVFVGDLNLHFDAEKLLFSSIGANNRWQVFEMKVDGSGMTQVTPGEYPDIDNYNGIYLPDGRIIFDANSSFVGVPCVGGSDYVGNLHLLSADRKKVRRLCFEQDNDWYPTMMPDGRVMFLRWEYTDSAHYFSRLLMTMNPDGTGQIEYSGSNSYWPNSLFYAKPLPGDVTKFVGIVSGHHGVPRMGELVLFDIARGRIENTGAVQRIPGRGKPVEDIIQDTVVDASWPKFLHPMPLSDKYFIVSSQPTPQSNWGVYLVDTFDNMVLIQEEPGYALLEPIPLRKTPTPPALPDKVKLDRSTATVSIQDIYSGRGLPGVPRGTVKSLRIFQYEYSYRNMGGHYSVGIEGPWDVRRLLGTVPVYPDGSASFEIPANTPVSVQALDAEGKAVQQKRSWFVGMPGEHVSCTGCHDDQNTASLSKRTEAVKFPPSKPKPWYGPKRGFGFVREVQPVLDKYCVGCHNGQEGRPNLADTTITNTSLGGAFPKSYIELHPFVRRNGPEGDYHTLTPLEFHADTSDLVQMLTKGHYNVKLDAEGWDRLITWIDLNVPAHGTWREIGNIPGNFEKRRREMQKAYAGIDEDIEAVVNPYQKTEKFIQPEPMPAKPAPVEVVGWPFAADKAAQMQGALGETRLRIDLGAGKSIELRRIPAGEYEMGDLNGYPDEYPTAKVRIDKPFWMAVTEVSLEQYQQFDPQHRNGYYDMHFKPQALPR